MRVTEKRLWCQFLLANLRTTYFFSDKSSHCHHFCFFTFIPIKQTSHANLEMVSIDFCSFVQHSEISPIELAQTGLISEPLYLKQCEGIVLGRQSWPRTSPPISSLNDSTCKGEAPAQTRDSRRDYGATKRGKATPKYLNEHTVRHTMGIKRAGQLDSYLNETEQQRITKTKRLDAWESYGPAIVTALLLSK